MLVLGISGGLDLIHENHEHLSESWFHDSAAVLADGGRIVAAVEEERLNRIKHTNKGPVSAIKFCLDSCGVRLKDLDRIAIYGDESYLTKSFNRIRYTKPLRTGQADSGEVKTLRGLIHDFFLRGLGQEVEDTKIFFVPHHVAHALSAYAQSGFDKSLVVTIDAMGDEIAGMVLNADGNSMRVLQTIPFSKSLGLFYLQSIGLLGFSEFEEYKVMGLAPYGDAATFRHIFRRTYELLQDGQYEIRGDVVETLAQAIEPRIKDEPLTQAHKDFAAALQQSLENIVLHMLRHYGRVTNQKKLCMAGGVAHNCTLNGKILGERIFEDVFIQPSSHDAGCAIGAALYSHFKSQSGGVPGFKPAPIEHVYWGPDVGDCATILATLTEWTDFIDFEHSDDIATQTAKLIADGLVVGWVQDRSEFGPRALGNRSIVADPRPAENKDIINSMVKKREAFRPFAPSVLEEYAGEFFDLPEKDMRFPFMTFVVKVRKEKQDILRATTHVDGTARIQTVSRQANRKYWDLIDAFRKITAVPVLLNTSFNNNVEPIVDSAYDALVCFLTTGLNCLVIGDYLITKKTPSAASYLELIPSIPLYARLVKTRKFVSRDEMADIHEVGNSYHHKYDVRISSDAFNLLNAVDGKKRLSDLLSERALAEDRQTERILDEVKELWSRRVIALKPVATNGNLANR